ncbi:MAG: glycosyltransferase family 4 protein, partial [Pirellulales bacterium]|nr:glycosyltransferase family 4 protein [Pirellulales bacterium]
MPTGSAPIEYDTTADAAPVEARALRIVAMVNNPCVVDARVIREASALAKAGHEMHVLAHAGRDVPDIEEVDGVTYRRFPVRANQRASRQATGNDNSNPLKDFKERGKQLVEEGHPLIQQGAQTSALWTQRAINVALIIPRRALKAVRYIVTGTGAELVRHARAYYHPAVALKPDVVHAHDLYTLLAGYLVAKKTGAKLVYDSHELEVGRNGNFSRWELLLRAQSERYLIKKADAVITVCDSIADYLRGLYGIERPTVVHNAPSIQTMKSGAPDVRSQLGLSKSVPIALYVGSVTINRGLEHCVRALPHADGVHLVCVGPRYKATEESILREARQLGVEDRLHLVDPVPHDEVTSFVRSSDVSLITIQDVCLSYRFCFPNKLLESLLTGLPIVVSRLVELERIVEMTGAGVVVDETDPVDIARGIRQILGDRDKYVPSREVVKKLKNTYSLEVQMDRLAQL